ncbi:citrate/2-methylcitrate synthase [Natronococcus roseus]|uniref:citrate/2-methylcitrate synthase n=1 Tax=Natronococcus roseus TaxID=1052014 RepID=UPI00374DF66F
MDPVLEQFRELSHAAQQLLSDVDDQKFFESVEEFENIAVRQLAERKPSRKLETNVEFYTAVLLHSVGILQELFTPIFAVSRVRGWTVHGLEELADTKIIRLTSVYADSRNRSWIPPDERNRSQTILTHEC